MYFLWIYTTPRQGAFQHSYNVKKSKLYVIEKANTTFKFTACSMLNWNLWNTPRNRRINQVLQKNFQDDATFFNVAHMLTQKIARVEEDGNEMCSFVPINCRIYKNIQWAYKWYMYKIKLRVYITVDYAGL